MVRYIEGSIAERNTEDILRIVRKMCINANNLSESPDAVKHYSGANERSDLLLILNYTWNIQPKRAEQVMEKNPVKRLIKRAIRKTIAWYAADLIEQQKAFNASVVRYLNDMDDVGGNNAE